jgi:hypothetical protein
VSQLEITGSHSFSYKNLPQLFETLTKLVKLVLNGNNKINVKGLVALRGKNLPLRVLQAVNPGNMAFKDRFVEIFKKLFPNFETFVC